MNLNVYLGHKFNANHQLAILLTRHLGKEAAHQEARRNGWAGVLVALKEQNTIITVPKPGLAPA